MVNASKEARAVTQGLKKKEYDDFVMGVTMLGVIALALYLGFKFNKWLGWGVFIAGGSWLAYKYYKE